MDVKSEIIKELDKLRGEYISGESLSSRLGITRQAVWKAVKKLIDEGYVINSVPNKGYMLDGKCDLLSSSIISDRTGATVYCYDEVISTNTLAMQKLLNDGECIVVAERQTFGRTKSGAVFLSPPKKGVYMSIALNAAFTLDKTDFFEEKLSESVASVLGDYCGTIPRIQNGNELFIDGKKVCGILIEGEVNLSSKTVKNVVIGIGVYTSEVGEKLGSISATEPRNALICSLYKSVKQVLKQ